VGAGPFAEVGRQTFDGKGNANATATVRSNGNIQPVTIQGTYTVKADCTGSMTLCVVQFPSTVHADLLSTATGRRFAPSVQV
jgi:predicted lipoprotein